MEKRDAFTLVELMVAILIVAILAAVAIPIMRGRVDSAKWTEGHTGAGTIRTSIRAYIAEHGANHDYDELLGCLCGGPIAQVLGFMRNDLQGRYFDQDSYVITDIDVDLEDATCVIEVTPLDVAGAPPGIGTLDEDGSWSVSID